MNQQHMVPQAGQVPAPGTGLAPISNYSGLPGTQTMARDKLAQSFGANPKTFIDECDHRKIPLSHLLNEKSPDPSNDKAPNEALFEICGHLKLFPRGDGYNPSSTVEEFFASAAGRQLFWAILDHDFERVLGVNQLAQVSFESAASEADLTPGGGFSPYDRLPVENRAKFSPRFGIGDLTERTQTIRGLSYMQPQFEGPTDADENTMKPVAPNAKIPTTTTIVGERSASLMKIGEGIKIDDNLIGNSQFMEAYRMQAELIALRTAAAIANQGVEIAIKSKDISANTNFQSLGANPDVQDVIRVNLDTGPNNAYMYNTIIMRQTQAQEWIYANIQQGSNNVFGIPPDRFNEVFPGIRVINNVGGPTRLIFVGDDDIDGWTDEKFITLDSRFSLIYVRRGNGMRDDSDTDIETQTRRRFMTQFFDWWLVSPDGVRGWRLS